MSGRLNPPTTHAPPNAPEGCPRRTDYTSGPRRCPFVTCALHIRRRDGRQNAELAELAREMLPDTCAVDIAERAGALRVTQIARVLGTDHQSVSKSLRRALLKVRLRVVR